jgi:hypothetical protein
MATGASVLLPIVDYEIYKYKFKCHCLLKQVERTVTVDLTRVKLKRHATERGKIHLSTKMHTAGHLIKSQDNNCNNKNQARRSSVLV